MFGVTVIATPQSSSLLTLLVLGCSAPAGEDTSAEGELTISFELSNYEGSGKLLTIANETLFFPLTRAPVERAVTRSEPGEFVVAYTRVGCWIDPEEWWGNVGSTRIDLTSAEPSEWTRVSIDMGRASTSESPVRLERETCLSVRSVDGTWRPFIYPTPETTADNSVCLRFSLMDVRGDAAAIFLPTYANISRVTYTLDALAPP